MTTKRDKKDEAKAAKPTEKSRNVKDLKPGEAGSQAVKGGQRMVSTKPLGE